MTDQQEYALAHPWRPPYTEPPGQPFYRARRAAGGGYWVCCLTVDADGVRPPVWHGSVSWRPDGSAAPPLLVRWPEGHEALARETLYELLMGVGDGHGDRFERGPISLQLRRPLTGAERIRVGG
jgi:hypothetical protein